MALAILAISLLVGILRGLVFEILTLAGWIGAFLLAQWFADPVGAWLPMGDAQATWRYAAGFALVFVAVAFGVGLVAALVRRMVTAVGLRPVDRALGAAFGLLRGALALLAVAVVVHVLGWQKAQPWREATSASLADVALAGLKPSLPEKMATYLP